MHGEWLILDSLPNQGAIITQHPGSRIKARWLVFKYQFNKLLGRILK